LQKGAFHLLVVFRRYTFRLTPSSASLALHACLGGTSAGFHVEHVKDRHFCISVADKAVGLEICALRRIISAHYDIYFHLWRDGGECWERELVRWQEEEENSWTKVVSRKKRGPSAKRISFSKQIVQDSPVKKSKPQELDDVIKIGTFFCLLEPTPSQRKTNKVLKFNFLPPVGIPVKEVFGRIHGSLQKIQAHPRHNRVPQSEKQIEGSGANLACSRCLAPGHSVRDCRGHLRCWFCAGYGHKKRICLQWKLNRRTKWVARDQPSLPPNSGNPHPQEGPFNQKEIDAVEQWADQIMEHHNINHNQQQQQEEHDVHIHGNSGASHVFDAGSQIQSATQINSSEVAVQCVPTA
jgi:hypothetical protein